MNRPWGLAPAVAARSPSAAQAPTVPPVPQPAVHVPGDPVPQAETRSALQRSPRFREPRPSDSMHRLQSHPEMKMAAEGTTTCRRPG